MIKRNNMNSIFIFLIFLSPLSFVINSFIGFNPLYFFLLLAYIFIGFKFFKEITKVKVEKNSSFFFVWVFFLVFVLVLGAIQNGWYNSLISLIFYTLYPLLIFTMIYFNNDVFLDSKKIVLNNVFISTFIGLLAIYQLNFDSTIWGLYKSGQFKSYEFWSVKRAASILGSIQVYSTYMLYTIFSIYLYKPFKYPVFNDIFLLVLFLMGTTSGSQSFFVLSALILLLNFKKNLIYLFPLTLLFLSVNMDALKNFDSLQRVFNIFIYGFDYFAGMNSGRLGIWLESIYDTNFLHGNGLGSASLAVDGSDRHNTESYLINMYYEGGVFFIISFLLVIFNIAYRLKIKYSFIFIFIFIFNLFSVHSMFSVFLFFPWLLVYLIFQDFRSKNVYS